nr:N-acetylmuramoyl-L-alanine amidase [Pseudonocardia sp. TRM90224]
MRNALRVMVRGVVVCGVVVCAVISACAPAPPTIAPEPVRTAAAPSAQPSTPPPPRVVVLDPGHNARNAANPAEINRPVPDGRGGTKACNTTGTQTDAGYPEHAFTFDVAQRVQRQLEAAGVRVVMTRPDDNGIGPCVDVRGQAGEQAGADAVVSIHADGTARNGTGFHVAVSDPPLNPAQEGPARALATALRDAMRGGGFTDSSYTGHEGISLRRDLAGLNLATRPAALVECGNMRNPAEAALMTTEPGRERYAAALASGVLAFLRR